MPTARTFCRLVSSYLPEIPDAVLPVRLLGFRGELLIDGWFLGPSTFSFLLCFASLVDCGAEYRAAREPGAGNLARRNAAAIFERKRNFQHTRGARSGRSGLFLAGDNAGEIFAGRKRDLVASHKAGRRQGYCACMDV